MVYFNYEGEGEVFMIHLLKENFGTYLLKSEFKIIYENTSNRFRNLLSFEQFTELFTDFNRGVNYYTCIVSNQFPGLQLWIWIDDAQSKAAVIAFDDQEVIQGIYLKPFETYS